MDVYQRLKELGLELPPPPAQLGVYKTVRQSGNLLYTSGQIPVKNGIPFVTGKVGAERTIEEGQEGAKICALNGLAAMNEFLGDLNKIKGLVKMVAFVASAPGFNNQPKVADGASQLINDIWGDNGLGVRSAVGVSELPNNISVEVEFIFELV